MASSAFLKGQYVVRKIALIAAICMMGIQTTSQSSHTTPQNLSPNQTLKRLVRSHKHAHA